MGIWEMNTWELVRAGGPLMAPILMCSVLACAICIEKFWYLSTMHADFHKFKNQIFDCVKKNNFKEALSLCEAKPTPAASILKAGIIKFGSLREEIKESMEAASLFEIPKLEGRLTILATIANISPLLGLLGTVTGITETFRVIQVRAASFNPLTPGDLAGGIWEALVTTAAGLIVAIPTFVAYQYFANRVNYIITDLEKASSELINLLCQISDTETAKKGRMAIEI